MAYLPLRWFYIPIFLWEIGLLGYKIFLLTFVFTYLFALGLGFLFKSHKVLGYGHRGSRDRELCYLG